MNRMQLRRSKRTGRRGFGGAAIGLAYAGLILCLAASSALAQTSAQRAALARLGLGRTSLAPSGARPQNAQPGGVQATTVPLLTPEQLAFDSAGNLYIADAGDNLIREVSVTGVITTAAGSGQEGFSGDGGAAANAQLDTPMGVAVDGSGNLFIADTNNERIREVSGGTISTIAGTGTAGFGGDGAPAAAAQLDTPTALAVDAQGNLYIADTGNQRIRKIAGTTITTVAGTGKEGYAGDGGAAAAANLDQPSGIAVDAAGNLYIGDTNNQRVRMVSAANGNISTLAGSGVKGFTGDGVALTIALAGPSGVAVDASGNVYFADADNDRIREISGGNVTTVAGLGVQGFSGDSGSATGAQLNTPRAVLAGSSVLLIADTENNVIRAITAGSISSTGGVPTSGAESLVLGSALTGVYGTGTLTATFANHGAAATGQVSFYDQQPGGAVLIGQSALAGNLASIGTGTLAAGTHSIVATYAGDAHNNAITSGVYLYVITPASLSAVADGVSLLYGQAIPNLSGTLTGVLPQDAGKVAALYATTATSTSDPGAYPITVSLSGASAADYSVSLGAGSGSVVIGQSPTTTALTASSLTPVFGATLTLTATITSTSGATPAGTVDFYNGAQKLNSSAVAVTGGVATFALSTLPVGTQGVTAVYSGNLDFVRSTSSALSLIGISPDFSIGATPATQTVLPAQSVDYTLSLTPMNATFVYPVTLTATGLPAGVTATFTPASVAAGSAATSVKLTLTAGAAATLNPQSRPFGRWPATTAFALLLPLAFWRRARKAASQLRKTSALLLALIALAIAASLTGCGGGGFFSHRTQTSTVTVTAVSGPDTHTTSVTFTVQ